VCFDANADYFENTVNFFTTCTLVAWSKFDISMSRHMITECTLNTGNASDVLSESVLEDIYVLSCNKVW